MSGTLSSPIKYTVSRDAATRKVTLSLTGGYYPDEIDTIAAGIQGVTNPTLSGSFVADVSTKNSIGQTVESMKTFPIYIKDAPAGSAAKTLTLQLVDPSNVAITTLS